MNELQGFILDEKRKLKQAFDAFNHGRNLRPRARPQQEQNFGVGKIIFLVSLLMLLGGVVWRSDDPVMEPVKNELRTCWQ